MHTRRLARYTRRMAAVDTLLEQALKLPEKQRTELVARLLRSLESQDDEQLTPDEGERAWSAELDRRVGEVRDGTVELVDGDAVFRAADARIGPRRP